mmetsp:Transcript_29029/g.66736  ORF Transcript_29029/g.66736 Transcript_29029/m.66736 type:complete len:88 (-) Transcript_29029:924-1187(-)
MPELIAKDAMDKTIEMEACGMEACKCGTRLWLALTIGVEGPDWDIAKKHTVMSAMHPSTYVLVLHALLIGPTRKADDRALHKYMALM